MRKVLVSLPETDLRVIDAASGKAGETLNSFVRKAALAEAHRERRPIDDPADRREFARLLRRAERRKPISTAEALEARDRGASLIDLAIDASVTFNDDISAVKIVDSGRLSHKDCGNAIGVGVRIPPVLLDGGKCGDPSMPAERPRQRRATSNA